MQKVPKATSALESTEPSCSVPAAAGATKTRTFLSHCLGRSASTMAMATDAGAADRRVAGPPGSRSEGGTVGEISSPMR